MSEFRTTVLLVENDPADAGRIRAALAAAVETRFAVEWVTRLADAVQRLGKEVFDVVLLDLTLPDGVGDEAYQVVFEIAPASLILVLGTAGDQAIAHRAAQCKADDYLVKDHVDTHWLPRVLRYLVERKSARDGLRDSELRFRTMSDASPLGIFVSDSQGLCTYSNAAYRAISGLSPDETPGSQWISHIHPDDRARVLAERQTAIANGAPFKCDARFMPVDGRVVWASLNGAAMHDGRRVQGQVLTVEDITVRKMAELALRSAEEALFDEKERAQVTLNSIGDAVMTTDLVGNVTYLNAAAEAMTGWSGAEATGLPLPEVFRIIDGATRSPAANPALQAIAENRTVALASNCVLIRRDGAETAIEDSAAPIHNRDGRVAGAVLVFHDVSESRAMTLKMAHLAHHDFLTGLPNRVLLTERLSQAIGQAHRHRKQVGLLFIDLDNFKTINDSLGHAIGDQLLQTVAERLSACVRATDTVCRQGGDEFVILLAEIEHPQDAAQVAEKLRAALVEGRRIGEHELHVTLSIGISIYPDDGNTADSVMKNADTAMYHAKACGRDNYQFFKSDMNTRAVRRMFVEANLRRAIEQDEFLLHYQPQIDLASGAMTGSEALIRWQDPVLGLVYPTHFVPIAEECGLIVPIGRWVLREACMQVRAWLDAGLPVVPVAVNVSATELRHTGFLDGVARILDETGLPPSFLELEVTETVLMHDADSSASVLDALKFMGVQLAIDDFGTGYSSLSYLRRFPIDTLKIDRSFVRDITSDTGDATIVAAVIGMGRNLRQKVIAEGVETLEQLAFLKRQRCDQGQGFQFSHPLAAEDFARLLSDGNGARLQCPQA